MRRRYEILWPVSANGDTLPVIAGAIRELLGHAGGLTCETAPVQGYWLHDGTLHTDLLLRTVCDVADTPENKAWFACFLAKYQEALNEIELYAVSCRIEAAHHAV